MQTESGWWDRFGRALYGGAYILTGVIVLTGIAFTPAPAHGQAGPLGNTNPSVELRCPVGWVLRGGQCVRPRSDPQCPPGTVGVPPNCRPVVRQLCPRGTAGVYPNCRPTLDLPPPLGDTVRPSEPISPRIWKGQ